MKYIKRFNESVSNEIESFLKLNGIENYRINSDQTIDVPGNLIIRTTVDIPSDLKFGTVGDIFQVRMNYTNDNLDLPDFKFFPESAKKWVINIPVAKYKSLKQSSYFWAKYSDLIDWENKHYSDFMGSYGIDAERSKMLSDYYIEMASNGGLLRKYSDELEAIIWEDAKGEFFNNSEVEMKNYAKFISYEDIDFNQVVTEAKSNNREACEILIGVMLNDDGYHKSKFDEINLGDIYDNIKSNKMIFSNAKELSKLRSSINMHLQKTPETIERDKNNDCYIFIARDGFKEMENGDYKKFLDIENMFKVDIYNEDTYRTINQMRLRTRFNNDSSLYMLWLPKDFFHNQKERIKPNDYQLELIDKYKVKI